MILVGLTGRKGVGKDTAFGFIHEWASQRGVLAVRRGFADALKQSFARLFTPDITANEAVQWCDSLKNHGQLILEEHIDDADSARTLRNEILMRTIFQRYGAEAHRDLFGEDFWVDRLLPTTFADPNDLSAGMVWESSFIPIVDFGSESVLSPEIAVVTDVRFQNEAQRLKDLGGLLIDIKRLVSNGPFVEVPDSHSSEQGFDPALVDLDLLNHDSLNDFRDETVRMMEKIFDDAQWAPS